jgi:hypothetical protein
VTPMLCTLGICRETAGVPTWRWVRG